MLKNPANYPFFTYSTAPSGKSHCSKQIRKPPLQRLTVAEDTGKKRADPFSVFLKHGKVQDAAGLNQLHTGRQKHICIDVKHKLQQAMKQPRAQGHWEDGTPKPQYQ